MLLTWSDWLLTPWTEIQMFEHFSLFEILLTFFFKKETGLLLGKDPGFEDTAKWDTFFFFFPEA